MRTTINIDDETYRSVKAVSARAGITMGRVVDDAIRLQYRPEDKLTAEFGTSSAGFTTVRIGRTITPEDVAMAIEED